MNVGTYFSSTERYGRFEGEVAGWTNTEYLWLRRDTLRTDPKGMIQALVAQAKRATVADRKIHLNVNGQEPSDLAIVADVIRAMKPFWGRVVAVEVADEPRWTQVKTTQVLGKVRAAIKAAGLGERPLGIVYTQQQFHGIEGAALSAQEMAPLAAGHSIDWPGLTGRASGIALADALGTAAIKGLDWIGLEGYVDPPGSPNSQANVDTLTKYLKRAMSAVPKTAQIVLVGQAYARNGAWTNMRTLAALQKPVADAAKADPRVIGVNWFSYGRDSGARQIPLVAQQIKKLSVQLLGKK